MFYLSIKASPTIFGITQFKVDVVLFNLVLLLCLSEFPVYFL